MSDNPKIIDAVSTPASVPVKINTSQLNKVLQDMASKAMTAGTVPGVQTDTQPIVERINPSTFMRDMSAEMESLYKRFDTLKTLAAELNGRTTDEQLPPQVIFRGLTLDFAISKDDKVTEHSVKMQALSCIGDISNLISNEFGFIIASLRELSKQVADLAQKTNERCVDAFKEWETSNKNKQIVPAGSTVSAEPTTTDFTPTGAPVGPVTLQTQ
jgi:hypothetical protein